MRTKAKAASRVVKPSRRLLVIFEFYLRWYIGRHFHGIRIANGARFPREVSGPLIIYLNHPSWWDPLTCIMVSRHFLPQADHYAPMDEAALERYGFFGKLGLFPVELDTHRGALQFLRSATEVLLTANSVLWLTPQGKFADARARPPVFKEGLASLLLRLPSATLLPLAIEYVYWDERLPEILVNPGSPFRIGSGGEVVNDDRSAVLAANLAAAQEELAALAVARDAASFAAILDGSAGIGVFYDLWRRLRSGMRGQRYEPEHGSIHRP
jgi:1-acyl-sn-glycerol-3-phosphate acyltransferase